MVQIDSDENASLAKKSVKDSLSSGSFVKITNFGYFKFLDSVLYVIYVPISPKTFFLTIIYFLIQDNE